MIIGIDPGGSGAMAALSGSGVIIDIIRNEATETDLWHWMREQKSNAELENESVRIYLEKVGVMPGNGRVSMFKFGQSFGFLRGLCVASGCPFETVTPQKWQAGLSIPKAAKSDSKTQHKNKLKAKAQELFPGQRITHKEADALLIAEYGRRAGI